MEDEFQISDPADKSGGDYLVFTITDHGRRVQAQISGNAIRKLAGTMHYDDKAVFASNKEKIRSVAHKHRRVNPGLIIVMLGELDFN